MMDLTYSDLKDLANYVLNQTQENFMMTSGGNTVADSLESIAESLESIVTSLERIADNTDPDD